METVKRRPFQGVFNIIRFNRHYYLLMGLILAGMYYFMNHSPAGFDRIWKIIILLGLGTVIISLVVSYFIYDYSSFYSLDWMKELNIQPGMRIANINAGFDETSEIMASKFQGSPFFVYDFYDPAKHTEWSIKRARQAYPPFPGTVQIRTTDRDLPEENLDYIFLIFAAHEIRDASERTAFFRILRGGLNQDGRILVVEHSRDIINFLAFSIGFLHFYSRKTWNNTFANASLRIAFTRKINPFVTMYTLVAPDEVIE